jgi:hypothetical protein
VELLLATVDLPALHDVYSKSMRNSLFTGFLTLSSFLLATKTFLVVQLRKDIYDQDGYSEMHEIQRPGQPLTGSLHKLARKLDTNIFFALITSVAQFTLGFVENWFALAACVGLAVLTIYLTFESVVHVRRNMAIQFEWIDEQHSRKIEKIKANAAATPPKVSP